VIFNDVQMVKYNCIPIGSASFVDQFGCLHLFEGFFGFLFGRLKGL